MSGSERGRDWFVGFPRFRRVGSARVTSDPFQKGRTAFSAPASQAASEPEAAVLAERAPKINESSSFS